MRKIHLIRRQIAASLHQSTLFVLCVVLSLVTLITLSGFSRSVHSSFLKDARILHAADIIIHSHSSFSKPLLDQLTSERRMKTIEYARTYEFYSIVRAPKQRASLLSNIKVVDPGYPFYGIVELASGRPFRDVLVPGAVIVEQALLDRLHLRVGDRLGIGSAAFIIQDVVVQEPDRPVNFFSLGPRVFVPGHDLAALELVSGGSRVNYTILAKVGDQSDLDRVFKRLTAVRRDRERVETFRTADSGVKRFFDNFLFFLNLVAIFTLLLAGIGIQSSVTAFLKEQERTIAVMKAVGAQSRFIIRHYVNVVFLLGLIGTILGLGASVLLEKALPGLFRGLLPRGVELTVSGIAVAEGLALGCVVVALFTFLPLFRLKEVRPRAIFGKEEAAGSRAGWLVAALALIFFLAMVLWRIREVKTGLLFVLGVGLLVLVCYLCAAATLRFLRTAPAHNLVLRQALKGLFRPRNATLWIIVTLSASVAVIFSIALVETNLDATFVRSYPPDSPNLFFIDIQPGQKDAFAGELGIRTIYYPVVRGIVTAVNGAPIDREKEQHKRRDNLGREFNLTFRGYLLEDERIVKGSGLYRNGWSGPQVSVMDSVLDMRDMDVGDVMTFNIQGVPVEARISSIRTRTHASLQPFFYFVFPDNVLRDAPHSFFTAVRVDRERISPLQNRIASKFPNVSVIDVTETISIFSRIMSRLSVIVNFFALFSVAAGILIIVSSVFATRYTRIQEAVYFTILGARARFVLAVFGVENLLIGLASGVTALAISQTASWIMCRYALDVAFKPFLGMSLLMVLATTLVVVAAGLGASIPILLQKPAAFLREQTEE